MLSHDSGFVWSDEERGSFRTDFFSPVDIPVFLHTLWVECNFRIPPGIYVILSRKRSLLVSMSHQTHLIGLIGFVSWRKTARHCGQSIVWSSLNHITIQHSGVPPIPKHLAEQFGSCACGGMLDLYVGYDERLITESSPLTGTLLIYGTVTWGISGWSMKVTLSWKIGIKLVHPMGRGTSHRTPKKKGIWKVLYSQQC
jgi:hypothetical protein